MCFVDLEKAFNRIPLGILWGIAGEYIVLGLSRLCTSVARAWSTLLVKYQSYSFCSSFLFAEFFFSEFAAEIEAAWLKISYKSKTTVLREGRSAHCDDLSKESRSDSALWTGLLYCGDTLTFRKSQLWKQRCCWSIYIHTLTYDQELWVMTKWDESNPGFSLKERVRILVRGSESSCSSSKSKRARWSIWPHQAWVFWEEAQ